MRLPDRRDQRHQAGTKVLNSAAIYGAEVEDPKLLPRRASAVVGPEQIPRVLKPQGCYAYINYAHADMRMVFCTQDVLGWGVEIRQRRPQRHSGKRVSRSNVDALPRGWPYHSSELAMFEVSDINQGAALRQLKGFHTI